MIEYISTRGGGEPQTFEQVLLAGLAPDGGLYVPRVWPQMDVAALSSLSYVELAVQIMYPFVEKVIPLEDFHDIVKETYGESTFDSAEITPLFQLKTFMDDKIYIMEQFHGPTLAFKDVALQLLGRLFDYVLKRRSERITIVGATSGDTGSAAIEGCKLSDNLDIFILHPKGRVSEVQRRQMTTILADNVHNIALEGTFDDCQNMVKAMFGDAKFRNAIQMSAVNSINWARIMAQIVYYFAAALKLGAPEKEVSFVVPTGNFGNVFAAYCARKMGLPIKHLAISTNKNDILTRFFETGEMSMGEAHATMSPSMDIQISSNFERYLFDLFGRDSAKVAATMEAFKKDGHFKLDEALMKLARQEFVVGRADDEKTMAMIDECYGETLYVIDPHTAVGFETAKSLAGETDGSVVLLATAHPSKFPDAVEKAIGMRPPLPPKLEDLMSREEKMHELPNDIEAVKAYVKSHSRAAG